MTFGYIQLQGWEGRTQHRVLIVGRTPKRVRIRAIDRTRLAGRRRWLAPGEESLIPAHALSVEPIAGAADTSKGE